MMGHRVNYSKVAPGTVEGMYTTNAYFDTCSIDQPLRRLVELRVSQINGCSYCIELHRQQALDVGVSEARIAALADRRSLDLFTEIERVSLDWAEANTRIMDGTPSDRLFNQLKVHFDERQIADLTAIASNMNALNRMAVSLRSETL